MDANDLGVLSVCLCKCIVVAPEKPQKELEGKKIIKLFSTSYFSVYRVAWYRLYSAV